MIDIRANSLQQAIIYLKKRYNKRMWSYYKIADTNIYRFIDCVELDIKQNDIDYKKAENKFNSNNKLCEDPT
jgi:ribosomal protein L1